MSEERLQKYLARAGVASRRKAEELIREGRVTVNGAVAEIGAKVQPERDAVKVDGKRVAPSRRHRYFLLNKPKGYLTARSDPRGRPTVFDLVVPRHRKALVAVGRLDFNTEGLLLLTDDGDFAQRVAHPRYGCSKTYLVKVKGAPDQAALARLRGGVLLDGRRTAPARITTRPGRRDGPNTWWRVELGEGRTRQIREMFLRVGHPVQKLRRIAIGALADPKLPPGSYRDLTPDEIEMLRGAAAGRPGAARRQPKARKRSARR